MKTFLSDFDILTNKRVVPHHSFTVQLTTISADDDITRNDGKCCQIIQCHLIPEYRHSPVKTLLCVYYTLVEALATIFPPGPV